MHLILDEEHSPYALESQWYCFLSQIFLFLSAQLYTACQFSYRKGIFQVITEGFQGQDITFILTDPYFQPIIESSGKEERILHVEFAKGLKF